MTDHSERRAEPFKSDECINCHHPEGLHGHGGCNWQPPFEYAAQTCGCRSFGSKASEPTRDDDQRRAACAAACVPAHGAMPALRRWLAPRARLEVHCEAVRDVRRSARVRRRGEERALHELLGGRAPAHRVSVLALWPPVRFTVRRRRAEQNGEQAVSTQLDRCTRCGHYRGEHPQPGGACERDFCDCAGFVPTQEQLYNSSVKAANKAKRVAKARGRRP
jgi:hypothetical protein